MLYTDLYTYIACNIKDAEILYAKRVFVGVLFMVDSYNKQSREHHHLQLQQQIVSKNSSTRKLTKRDVTKMDINDDDNHADRDKGRKQSSSYLQIKLELLNPFDCNENRNDSARTAKTLTAAKTKRLESMNDRNDQESMMIRLSYINKFD